MSMNEIRLGVQLSFDTEADRAWSEDILLRLLGIVSRVNRRYLRLHPETPLLYESGVVYSPPDQLAEPRVRPDKLPDLMRFLRSIGASEDTVVSVIRYIQGVEEFQDIPTLRAKGSGDCDRLTCWRTAELWMAGYAVTPYLVSFPNDRGGTTYHAVVKYLGDGSSEDPSLILGMGGEARRYEREEEKRKNRERQSNLAKRLLAAGEVPRTVLGTYIRSCGFVPRGGFPC